MLRRQSRRLLLASTTMVVLVLGAERTQADQQRLIAAVRAAAEAQCDCGGGPTPRAYMRCISQTARTLAPGRLSNEQMHEASAGVQRATCGRSGRVTCCKTNQRGRVQCRVVHAGECTAPPGGSACVSGFSSACDAAERGCVPLETPPHDINCCLPVAGAPFDCEPQKPSEC